MCMRANFHTLLQICQICIHSALPFSSWTQLKKISLLLSKQNNPSSEVESDISSKYCTPFLTFSWNRTISSLPTNSNMSLAVKRMADTTFLHWFWIRRKRRILRISIIMKATKSVEYLKTKQSLHLNLEVWHFIRAVNCLILHNFAEVHECFRRKKNTKFGNLPQKSVFSINYLPYWKQNFDTSFTIRTTVRWRIFVWLHWLGRVVSVTTSKVSGVRDQTDFWLAEKWIRATPIHPSNAHPLAPV